MRDTGPPTRDLDAKHPGTLAPNDFAHNVVDQVGGRRGSGWNCGSPGRTAPMRRLLRTFRA